MEVVYIVLGVGLLYLGGEGLVRGGVAVGRAFGLSPLVIGLTIVSMGTSSPELAASVAGVLKGAPAVAFGNVVGSNIANLTLVLGLTAAIWPLNVRRDFLRRDVPVMLLASACMFWLVANGWISRPESVALLSALALYLRFLLWSKAAKPEVEAEFAAEYGRRRPVGLGILAALAGIALLVGGAQLLVAGAVGLARSLGVGERVIGLTIVAFGTSLPELASSLVAAFRREGDIVLGNLIGSNIFNILLILGATAAVHPVAVETAAAWLDLSVMMGVSLLVALFLTTGSLLTRWEGLLLIGLYGAYVVHLFT